MRQRIRVAVPMLAILAASPVALWNPLKLPPAWATQVSASREASRERWQKVPEIFSLMGVRTGSAVADVGAGHGFFTVRLADAVGEAGLVYAVDVSSQALRDLRARVAREGRENVTVVEGETDNPRLPAGRLDAALINNAYHEMDEHQAMLEHLWAALKPCGRLVIVDQVDPARRDAARRRQTRSHEIAPELVEQDLEIAGFEIVSEQDPFIGRDGGSSEAWWVIVARRPEPDVGCPKLLF